VNRSRPIRTALLGAALSLLVAFLGCDLPGTGGGLVEVDWRFQATLPADGPAVVETVGREPWEVELLEARLLVGPAYLFAPPVTDRSGVAWLFAPARAFAHAGDDNTGGAKVVSELLDQFAVDLLDREPRALQSTLAEAGPVDSMNVLLDEARFELAGPDGTTHGGHAFLRGVARRQREGAEQMVRFSAVLRDTVPNDRIARRVESLPVEDRLDQGSTIAIHADARRWVRQMRFDDFVSAEGEVRIDEPSQLHNAWYLGLRDPAGWEVRIADPSPSPAND